MKDEDYYNVYNMLAIMNVFVMPIITESHTDTFQKEMDELEIPEWFEMFQKTSMQMSSRIRSMAANLGESMLFDIQPIPQRRMLQIMIVISVSVSAPMSNSAVNTKLNPLEKYKML